MPYKATVARNQYAPLLRRLARLTEDTAQALRGLRKPLPSDRILLAFLGKAVDTLRGLLILQREGLCHEAQTLARTLFELRLSFDAFVELLRVDVTMACMRVMDMVMLEKAKQQRVTNYRGREFVPQAPTPADWHATEREIESRYPTADFERLKKHGFTGMNVEERAKQSGLSDEYNVAYRNFSRNVHSTDFTELLLQQEPTLFSTDLDAYLESRDAVCCEVAYISVAGIAINVNQLAGLRLDRRIMALVKTSEKVRDATRSPLPTRPVRRRSKR